MPIVEVAKVFAGIFVTIIPAIAMRHSERLRWAPCIFGALTSIGSAPNFIIKAIAEDRGVAMPSFLGYFGRASLVMLALPAPITAAFV